MGLPGIVMKASEMLLPSFKVIFKQNFAPPAQPITESAEVNFRH